METSTIQSNSSSEFLKIVQTFLTSSDYLEHRKLGLAVFVLFFLIGMLIWS
jgi:hypothetical protein